MDEQVTDEALRRLLDKGHEDIRTDPELTEKVRQHTVTRLDELAARIAEELGLE